MTAQHADAFDSRAVHPPTLKPRAQADDSLTIGATARRSATVATSDERTMHMIEQRDWLLILLALKDADRPLDRMRLQTGMFLLAKHCRKQPTSVGEWRTFEDDVDTALTELTSRGEVYRDDSLGREWTEFVVTEPGLQRAQKLVEDERLTEWIEFLDGVKRDVLTLGYRDLAGEMTAQHPDFLGHKVLQ
jgi:hypothetical protein